MITFKSDVYATVNEKFQVVGQVDSTYMVDGSGNYIINPSTGNPYIIPVGYNPEDTLDRFNNPSVIETYIEIVDYRTGQEYDLQRNLNGVEYGGFVKDYTPIASFDFGLAAAAGTMNLLTAELGGGMVNQKNVISTRTKNFLTMVKDIWHDEYHKLTPVPNNSGVFWNNIENPINIKTGFDYYNKIGQPIKGWAELWYDRIASTDPFTGMPTNDLDPFVNNDYNNARNWVARRDPLTLDLDGDGLETVGIDSSNPLLFDHDGDGVSNATGWIKPDDGFLVLDRNGDGLINNGTELFGDSTPLFNATGEFIGKAADGFAALTQQDSNHDGVVNEQDANWTSLRVWQDADSNGVTDEGELHTLESQGIAGLKVAKTENTTTLANGNEIADLGHFIRTDGSEGTLGNVTGAMADVDLADNPFYRSFSDTIPTTPETAGLPDMQGSGALRDLREAASLSPALAAAITSYAAADTRAGQMALLDGVISQWAGSSDFQTSIEKAAPIYDDSHIAQGYRLIYLIPGITSSDWSSWVYGNSSHTSSYSSSSSGGGGGGGVAMGSRDIPRPPTIEEIQAMEAETQRRNTLLAQQTALTEMIGILEKFNGLTFVNIEPTGVTTGANQFIAASSGGASSGGGSSSGGVAGPRLPTTSGPVFVSLSSTQIDFLNRSYAALQQSVYDGLLLQTRLKPYVDAISLTIDETGIGMDFTDVDAGFQTRYGQAPAEAVRDLLDLQRIAGTSFNGLGWNGYGQLRGWLADAIALDTTDELLPALTDFGYASLQSLGKGDEGNDLVMGADTGAELNGGAGKDLLLGGSGDDTLRGGSDNDVLYGGAGSDTYVFNLGDGQDAIVESNGETGSDTLSFGAGIHAGDLDIYADGDKLVFAHLNGRDKVSIANWFGSLSDEAHRIDIVRFADGATFQLAGLQLGTAESDTLIGLSQSDILMGGAGDDTLITDGDDFINGGPGVDTMTGSIGNDIYVVDNANDTIIELAGEGVDTVDARVSYTLAANVENLRLRGTAAIFGTGNELDNAIQGNGSANGLYGLTGNDTLNGGAGNDTLDGGTGTDLMGGGTGDDSYIVDTLDDIVIEQAGQGTDTVHTDLTYTLGANLENLTQTGSEAVLGTGNELNNVLVGNAADNVLTGLAGNDTLDGEQGADTLLGGTGDDSYVIDEAGDIVVESVGEGTDLVHSSITYTLTDHAENLALTGTAALDGTGNVLDNRITGNEGANILTGLEGNDWLDGKGGADALLGGTGNDTYVIDNAADTVLEHADEGADTVQSTINYALGDNVENLTLAGGNIDGTGNALDNVIVGSAGNNTLDGGVGADTMVGGGGNDTYHIDSLGDTVIEQAWQGIDTMISPFDYTLAANVENLTLTGVALNGTGNELDNLIVGTAADNTLTGLDGKDTLDGGAGADNLIGGQGDDTYVVDNLLDTPTELAGEGVDTVQSSLTWTLGNNLDNLTLTGTASINGTGNELNNVIIGNSGANTLTGLEGDDTLDGGLEADVMQGGTGNDTYVVDNAGDAVMENTAEGIDLVQSSIDYTLVDNIENLTLTGPSAVSGLLAANTSGTGNALDNIIIGNRGNNTLAGLDGNDTLNGAEGVDSMSGGTGDDLYLIDNAGDLVLEAATEGFDTVQASVTHTLFDNVENLTLTGTASINGSGNALGNTITGNSGANILDGGLGIDTMAGGAGSDTFVVNDSADAVLENAGEGSDSVLASVSYTLSEHVESLTLTGTDNLEGTGNALANTLTGNSGNNTLLGLDGNDSLVGNGGNDLLNGGTGADAMQGGTGDDTYVVDNAGDTVTEVAGEGSDTVQSGISYLLADTLENLILTGSDAIDGTGNALGNTITGNSAGNTLDGGLGTDAMAGGTGDDTYVVDEAGDTVFENADAGIDTVHSSVSYALTGNVENLVLAGADNLNGTGNALDNAMTGTTGDNLLDGGTGVDTLAGGAGNDSYIVDNTADIVVEELNAGIDNVAASASYTLSANIENLTLTGSDNINGTGNALANTIIGNSGENILTGGAGDDTYVVDNAGDLVAEGLDEGADLVQSGITYTLTSNVENLTLTGAADLNGTGNALSNIIIGNSGANVLDGDAGADSMSGGAGSDTYMVDNTGDTVTEALNAGTDIVYSSVTHTLSANVENLTLTGSGNINGTGNTLGNIILGNESDNQLFGLAGNDALIANGGNDLLDGGLDADAMAGGAGDDTYVVDNAGDLVAESLDEGEDSVQSSISYALTTNVENLTLTGAGNISGTGNELDNAITGNSGSNVLSGLGGSDTLVGNGGSDTLDGGLGADAMAGGQGSDTYVVDDAGDLVVEGLNEGADLVQSSITYTLTSNVENLTLTGAADLNGAGNALGNIIIGNSGANILDGGAGADTIVAGAGNDTVMGGDGNDALSGEAGSDVMTGDAGNDTLNGGLDADTMAGGTGNDTYVVDNAGDLVTENLADGTDLVQSSITYTLTDHVENLTLTGTANINGTGNVLNNIINGNTGANVLSGLEGNDTVNGNTGADTLIGGDGNDALNGEAGNDQLFGDAGNDVLNGGLDADAMAGGTGDDTYVVDNVGDVVTENLDEGTDNVQSSVTYTLSANVENLALTGTANINGTGNALNNIVIGNSGSNVLSGLAGNDTLTGNVGNDTLDGGLDADTMTGGQGNDTYVVDNVGDLVTEGLNEGTDLVQSNITYTLTNNVENLTLTGADDIDGTGNALNNIITGNSGANIVNGGLGADAISAGAGNDTVIGGDGNDVLSGEAGEDQLFGDAGNDVLNGGLDADMMQGGMGDDTYVVDDIGDLVTESLNEGADLVQSSITYTLTSNVENLTLTGSGNINGTGNGLGNIINGNTGANVLNGLEGNDTVNGNTGADTLMGGDGNDALNGDAGNDQLFGDGGNDVLNGGLDADAMAGGAGDDTYVVDNAGDLVAESMDEGTDSVQSSISYALTANVENLTLAGTANISGAGNELDNAITGNSGSNVLSGLGGSDTLVGHGGNDTLDGGLGADAMAGGQGSDTYVVDDAGDLVVEGLNEGVDLVQSSITYTLTSNVENLTLTGAADLNGAGNALGNIIIGNSGANILDGGAGADTLIGGAGDDTYRVDHSSDAITESASGGTDTVFSGATYTLSANIESLTLTGTANINGTGNASDNFLLGNSGANSLSGDAGNDTLNGDLGADTMAGGMGDDIYIVENSGDVVVEAMNAGTDSVQSGISYTLSDHVENLVLTGMGNLSGTGNTLNNTLSGTGGNNILDGDAGADAMAGGAGDDTYVVDNAGDLVTESLNEGADSVQSSISYALTANVENLTLTGAGSISGTGNALNNMITGTAGANVLDGGAGADALVGGAGNDTYIVDEAGDSVTEVLGEGVDTVKASIDYALGAELENLVLTDGATTGRGNQLDNTLTGNDLDNALSGEAGNDILLGGQGNDVLDGGTGSDAMSGGVGNDLYLIDNAADQVIEAEGEGIDTVHSSIDSTLTANVENLVLTGSAIQGAGNALDNVLTANDSGNALSGDAGSDILLGGAGHDTLNGGADADTMSGGAGNDQYRIDNEGDQAVEAADEGTDTVYSSIDYTLAANVENLVLTGNAIQGAGNALDNVLTGNDLGNALMGDAGFDTLLGGAGQDRLDGGTSADTMSGAFGNDIYVVDDAGDQVLENSGEGNDTVFASVDYTMAENVENLFLTGAATHGSGNGQGNVIAANDLGNTLFGDAGNDYLAGGAAHDVLDGGTGSDTLSGGAGDDTYRIDSLSDLVIEAADAGNDTVNASIDFTLVANVENLILTGDATRGTGNTLDNSITANGLGSTLSGVEGNDTLNGGAGDDVLDGGMGTDRMSGNGGNDNYVVDNTGDVVIESADAGTDSIQASVSYTLTGNVENLTLTGSVNTSGTGNDLDNVITGNVGDNTLDGGSGADVMSARAGNDIYVVDNTGDEVIETLFGGTDTVQSSISYRLAEQVENLKLTGATDINGTGNALDNMLSGNGGSNILDGGTGSDVMMGSAGNDTYIVDSADDAVVEEAGEGSDTVKSSVSYMLAENVENLSLTGVADIGATGNALANVLVGNSGNNTLDGGVGNDTLVGGSGGDILLGGDGNDVYLYNALDGLDQITDTSGIDTLRFGAGLTRDNVVLRIISVNGQQVAQLRVLNGGGCEQGDQGINFVVTTLANGQIVSPIEKFLFDNGQELVLNDLLIKQTSVYGTHKNDVLFGNNNDDSMSGDNGNDTLYGFSGHDTLDGGNGADVLYGGGGLDKLYGGNQSDILYGECGDDLLDGGNGADRLYGGGGNDVLYGGKGGDGELLDGGDGDDLLIGDNGADILYGGAGNDTLYAGNGNDVVQSDNGHDVIDTGEGNDLVEAGDGNDIISTGAGRDWIAGGKGDDAINAGSGRNVFAFNRGDGADTITNSLFGNDTISIGKEINYADLVLTKSGNDLVLGMGQDDSITLSGWYTDPSRHGVGRLQVVTAAQGGDYNAASSDKTRNQKVELYDFDKIVQRYDAAHAASPALDQWAVMNGLLDAHLLGSDTAAIGGDLSYQYAANGSLTGIGLNAAQDILSSASFNSATPQALQSRTQLEQGAIKLG